MINYSAYWQEQQKKQVDIVPQPQKQLKQPKNDVQTVHTIPAEMS